MGPVRVSSERGVEADRGRALPARACASQETGEEGVGEQPGCFCGPLVQPEADREEL